MKTSILEDINIACEWIIECFKSINIKLDYSIESLQSIEKFLAKQIKNGKPKLFSILRKNYGRIVFGISCYLGEVINKNIQGTWKIDENDPNSELNISIIKNDAKFFPVQKVMKRIAEGNSNNIYIYAQLIIKELAEQTNK